MFLATLTTMIHETAGRHTQGSTGWGGILTSPNSRCLLSPLGPHVIVGAAFCLAAASAEVTLFPSLRWRCGGQLSLVMSLKHFTPYTRRPTIFLHPSRLELVLEHPSMVSTQSLVSRLAPVTPGPWVYKSILNCAKDFVETNQ